MENNNIKFEIILNDDEFEKKMKMSEKIIITLNNMKKINMKIHTCANSSKRPNKSFNVRTNSEADNCSDNGVKLTISAYNRLY